jgi:hypothetical protein
MPSYTAREHLTKVRIYCSRVFSLKSSFIDDSLTEAGKRVVEEAERIASGYRSRSSGGRSQTNAKPTRVTRSTVFKE